ncbi:MAG: 3-deoxy-7-phosphoheptulonate synthase class II [Bifidobacteriaceae bacterium]|jgi:3-deoxy-7-phosphoheptulonate synthase|nr:3-deoxy-7-phosphoheptulonate synthase class II [Bifidobacteriaceae bacterium]
MTFNLDSYRDLPAAQQPEWPDPGELAQAVAALKVEPPLVFAGEADVLRERLADAAQGRAFVLQGGDCAEIFAEVTPDRIRSQLRTILQMAVILTYGASLPVVKMGRIAGQYAKPRSASTETRGAQTLPAYRGDAVNAFGFTPKDRRPDPWRMVRAYHRSSSTLNLVRAFTTGGFADLRFVADWNRGFMANPAFARYEEIAGEVDRAISFMEACGVDFDALKTVELFACHEALLLDYERALTRIDSRTETPYDCSAHFVWVGERTRDIGGAHVDLLSKVRNPIGVKIGPTAQPEDVVRLADRLDPDGIPGRLTLITRLGADRVRTLLPPLIEAVQAAGRTPVWVCDPMHGNTITTGAYKTRHFDVIMNEVRAFFEVHREHGSVPGGLHVELTGDDVTEVLGGSQTIHEATLARRYATLVDPRLNHQQSLEMAFQVAEMIRDGSTAAPVKQP